MRNASVHFDDVWKYYPLYHHMSGGIKRLIFNFPSVMRQLRNNRFLAVKGLTFRIKRGSAFGIIGNNGAGKSTVLGLIAGVMKPTSGRVTVKGRVSPLLELGAGFHHELTGRENIILNGVLLGLTRDAVLRRLDEIIEFSGIKDHIDQTLRTYSSGMLARLGFSVVAHLDPEILLIDEILAVGDIEFQKKCISKIMEFKKKGVTIVFVTHNLRDMELVCDEAMWIEDREIKMLDSTQKVTSRYSMAVTGKTC